MGEVTRTRASLCHIDGLSGRLALRQRWVLHKVPHRQSVSEDFSINIELKADTQLTRPTVI